VGVAIVQGALGGLIFLLLGINAALLWAVDEMIECAVSTERLLSSLKEAALEEYTLYGQPITNGRSIKYKFQMHAIGDVVKLCQYFYLFYMKY
jgi:hypothetical protein